MQFISPTNDFGKRRNLTMTLQRSKIRVIPNQLSIASLRTSFFVHFSCYYKFSQFYYRITFLGNWNPAAIAMTEATQLNTRTTLSTRLPRANSSDMFTFRQRSW